MYSILFYAIKKFKINKKDTLATSRIANISIAEYYMDHTKLVTMLHCFGETFRHSQVKNCFNCP